MKSIRVATPELLCDEILTLEKPNIYPVDNGIGAYEYWGFKGVDSQPDFEIDSEEVTLILQPEIPLDVTGHEFSAYYDILHSDVEIAVRERESVVRRIFEAEADDSGKDFDGDIIILGYYTRLTMLPKSTLVYKIEVILEWNDVRC